MIPALMGHIFRLPEYESFMNIVRSPKLKKNGSLGRIAPLTADVLYGLKYSPRNEEHASQGDETTAVQGVWLSALRKAFGRFSCHQAELIVSAVSKSLHA
jgi:hypothetical protein